MKKICNRCGKEKDYEDFHKHKGNKTGRTTFCKVCVSEVQKENQINIRSKHYEWMANHPEHKKYQNAYNKEYRQHPDFKERNKEYQKKYARTERGRIAINLKTARRRKRSRLLINDITIDQILQIKESQNNTCPHCNRAFTDQLPYEIDHIIPVSKSKPGDPGLTMGNVQLLCGRCNKIKSDKLKQGMV